MQDLDFFVVDTSFQMRCAKEARAVMAEGRTCRLVIEARGAHEGRASNLTQILDAAGDGWASIDIVHFPRYRGARRSLVRLWRLWRIRLKYGKGGRVFAGTFSGTWSRRIAGILGKGSLIRLDDGGASITLTRRMREAGLDQGPEPTAFTMFRQPGDGPGFIGNDFALQLASAREDYRTDPDLAWIIGGAYSESRVLTPARELAAILQVTRHLGAARNIYMPHRADREEKLAQLRAAGIEVAVPGPDFETRLRESTDLPAKIGGIASTALFMAAILRPAIPVTLVRLDPAPNEFYRDFFGQAEASGMTLLPETPG